MEKRISIVLISIVCGIWFIQENNDNIIANTILEQVLCYIFLFAVLLFLKTLHFVSVQEDIYNYKQNIKFMIIEVMNAVGVFILIFGSSIYAKKYLVTIGAIMLISWFLIILLFLIILFKYHMENEK